MQILQRRQQITELKFCGLRGNVTQANNPSWHSDDTIRKKNVSNITSSFDMTASSNTGSFYKKDIINNPIRS